MKPYKRRNENKKQKKKTVYFVAADRIEHEKTTTFNGCSCVIKLSPQLEIINICGKRDVLLLETLLKF